VSAGPSKSLPTIDNGAIQSPWELPFRSEWAGLCAEHTIAILEAPLAHSTTPDNPRQCRISPVITRSSAVLHEVVAATAVIISQYDPVVCLSRLNSILRTNRQTTQEFLSGDLGHLEIINSSFQEPTRSGKYGSIRKNAKK